MSTLKELDEQIRNVRKVLERIDVENKQDEINYKLASYLLSEIENVIIHWKDGVEYYG